MHVWLTDDDWQAIGSLGQMFSAIATSILALIIALEARKLRQAEWTVKQNQIWSDFNRIMLDTPDDSAASKVVNGIPVAEPTSNRDVWTLFCFFNVVSSEFQAIRAKSIVSDYVLDSFMDTASVMAANLVWIAPFLRRRGYEEPFVAVLEILAENSTNRLEARRRLRGRL